MIHKTEQRNREIFAAHQQGNDVQTLAERYNLSPKTVQQIILFERHKQEVSAEPYYQGDTNGTAGPLTARQSWRLSLPAPEGQSLGRNTFEHR